MGTVISFQARLLSTLLTPGRFLDLLTSVRVALLGSPGMPVQNLCVCFCGPAVDCQGRFWTFSFLVVCLEPSVYPGT